LIFITGRLDKFLTRKLKMMRKHKGSFAFHTLNSSLRVKFSLFAPRTFLGGRLTRSHVALRWL